MTTEQTTTTEGTPVVETQVAQVADTPSLEDVYKEVGITEAQPQSPVAPAVVATPAVANPEVSSIPDPYDDAHKAFLQSLVDKQTALEATQQQFVQERAMNEASIAKAKLEEDIQEATVFVRDNAGLNDLPYDDKQKLALANFELNERARNDPKFKALWDARNNSPANKAALNKALGIISKEIGKRFEAKIDPTLAANRKALKAAQTSSATTDEVGERSPLENLQGAEFDQAWNRMVRGYN